MRETYLHLQQVTIRNRWLFLVILLSIVLIPSTLRGQSQIYISDSGSVVGTSDSRLAATIVEYDDGIVLKLVSVGEIRTDALTFSFFYNPDVLVLSNSTFTSSIEDIGNNAAYPILESAMNIDQDLLNKGFVYASLQHREKGLLGGADYSYNATMRVFIAEISHSTNDTNKILKAMPNEIVPVFSVYLKKLTPNTSLLLDDIGIATKTSVTGGRYCPRWSYEDLALSYAASGITGGKEEIIPRSFLYRSYSTVSTNAASLVEATTATLNGFFSRGQFSSIDTILNLNTGTKAGLLRSDSICRYGFIYSDSDATIRVNEFRDSVIVDGVNYAMPTSTGSFTYGTKTFNIIINQNIVADQEKDYNNTLTGLEENTTYYAWALAGYVFETSKPYALVGEKITFKTTIDCDSISTGTIHLVSQPMCGTASGSIRLEISGGSGNYEYQVNDTGSYKDLTNDTLKGLSSGTYRIYVRDKEAQACGVAMSEAITLHPMDTDLDVKVIPTNANSCGTNDGSLSVQVSGGTSPYSYFLNGAPPTTMTGDKIANLTPGVYVLDVIDDAGCLVSSGEIIIKANDGGLQASVTNHISTVCGDESGSFTITVNGTAPYQYQIDGGIMRSSTSGTIVINNLSAGSHVWQITDDLSCYAEGRDTIGSSDNDNFSFIISSITDASCDGVNGGSISIEIRGGIPSYEYSYDNGANWIPVTGTTAIIPDLAQGSYDIIVQDNASCTYEYQKVKIGRGTNSDLLVGSIHVVSQPMCGTASGSIRLDVSGGSGNYEYQINDTGSYKDLTNDTLKGLSSGTYRIYVRDKEAQACGVAMSEAITLHPMDTDLDIAVIQTNASNCGVDDGSLSVQVSGGTSPYSYLLNGAPPTTMTGDKIEDLTPGVYILDVIDDGGCVVSSGEIIIKANDGGLQASVTNNISTVCGDESGSLTITVNGTAPYQYQIDGGIMQSSTSGTIVINNLRAGSHVWRITDDLGCYAEGRDTIGNSDNDNFSFIISSITDASCDGVNGGSISIEIRGGIPSYEYSYDHGTTWTPITGTTATIPDLAQGSYDIIVQDNASCTYEYQKVKIGRGTNSDLLIGSIHVVSQPICGTTSGSIRLDVSGGSGNYEYQVNDTGSYKDLTNDTLKGLSSGTYRIYVRDKEAQACGVAMSEAITLHPMDTDLDVTVIPTNASNCGVDDGSLRVQVSGGISPYSYFLNGAPPTTMIGDRIANLTPGVYVLDVTDDAGCLVSSGEIVIRAGVAGLTVIKAKTSDADCGAATGAFTLTVRDGILPYYYQIDGNIRQTSTSGDIIVSGLAAGVHVWKVEDAAGCYANDTIEIVNNNDPTYKVTVVSTDALCDGLSGGTITLMVSGGDEPFQYSINNGTTWTPITGPTAIIPDLAQGSYDIIVQDNASCTYEYQKVKIGRGTNSDLLVGSIHVVSQPMCGRTTGSIRLEISGGSGNYEYQVNDTGSYKDLTNDTLKGLSSGTYRIYVRDKEAQACGVAMSEAITLHPMDTDLDVKVIPTNANSCGTNDGSLSVQVSGGTSPYSYLLNGAPPTTMTGDKIANLTPGVYVLDVIDDADCLVSSGEIIIKANDGGLQASVTNHISTVCGDESGSLTITVNGTAPYQYQIDGGIMRSSTSGTIVINNLRAGNHVWWIADDSGCYAEGRDTIGNSDNDNFSLRVTTTDVQCDGISGGSITLNVSGGIAPYQYTMDNGSTWVPFTGNNTVELLVDILQGNYDIIVKDKINCIYEYQNIIINHTKDINPPTATTPQIFCSGAVVENLYAIGAAIKWYDAPIGGNELTPSTILINENIYYAAQLAGVCESPTRTAVKVILDNNIIIDVPRIASPQYFCAPATLADIAIREINPNDIAWYDAPLNGNLLPLNTLLKDSSFYYAALTKGGNCESVLRTEVEIIITTEISDSLVIKSPQYFCGSATLANLTVPNNQVVWYDVPTGGSPIDPTTLLFEGIYYAAQKAGSCISTKRALVEVIIGTPEKPVAPENQAFCSRTGTLADISVSGYGIVWYATQTSTERLPLNTPLVDGTTYYASQSSATCDGERLAISVSFNCYTVRGTVFPFVHENDPDFNKLFPVIVKLYPVPAADDEDRVGTVLYGNPLYTTAAVYYDGSEFIQGTPKNPGRFNAYNNPGLPIDWSVIGKTQGVVDTATLSGVGDMPTSSIGMYKFEGVGEGDYILEIFRQGYMIRWAKITVSSNASLGHREILPGDVNGDLFINAHDLSSINKKSSMYKSSRYDPKYDFNANGIIGPFEDNTTIISNFGIHYEVYEETKEWVEGY